MASVFTASDLLIVPFALGAAGDRADDSAHLVAKMSLEAAAARANEAITLYGLGRRDEAVRIAKQVVRRLPGYTDLHVLLAADAWSRDEGSLALTEWDIACSQISSGCAKYREVAPGGWLSEVRRWPPNLVALQRDFLERRAPVSRP